MFTLFYLFIYFLASLYLMISHLQLFVADCRKALQEESKRNSNSVIFRLYVIVIGIYAGVQFLISFLMRIPACHRLTNECDRWPFIRFVKWMRQVVFNCISFDNCISPSYFLCSISCSYAGWLVYYFVFFSVDWWRNGIMLDGECMKGVRISYSMHQILSFCFFFFNL